MYKRCTFDGTTTATSNHKVANQEEVDLRVKDLQDTSTWYRGTPYSDFSEKQIGIGVGFGATFVCASFSCLHKA